MERLIKDANEWGAQRTARLPILSIDSFSDVIQAIQQIQEKQHIAGTTAREAASTIEGSVSATKAAWTNWLAELGKSDADMDSGHAESRELIGGCGKECDSARRCHHQEFRPCDSWNVQHSCVDFAGSSSRMPSPQSEMCLKTSAASWLRSPPHLECLAPPVWLGSFQNCL